MTAEQHNPPASEAEARLAPWERPVPPLKALSYLIQAGLLHLVIGFLRLFGIDRASAIGAWIGRRFAGLGKKPSTYATVRQAFPELADAEISKLLDSSWENTGRILAELAHLEKFRTPEGIRHFRIAGLEHLDAALARGKGVVIVSGHFGNWELSGPVMTSLGHDYAVVTRPPNNRWVADFIYKKRVAAGLVHQLPRSTDSIRQLYSRVKRGGIVGLLIDQRVLEGIHSPLFGHPVLTTQTPATLAVLLGAAVLPLRLSREEGANFEFRFHPPLLSPASGNSARDIVQLTGELNGFIEGEIRRRPAQWLWGHRRFKLEPELSRRAQRLMDDVAKP